MINVGIFIFRERELIINILPDKALYFLFSNNYYKTVTHVGKGMIEYSENKISINIHDDLFICHNALIIIYEAIKFVGNIYQVSTGWHKNLSPKDLQYVICVTDKVVDVLKSTL